eukprot:s2617_g3.t1
MLSTAAPVAKEKLLLLLLLLVVALVVVPVVVLVAAVLGVGMVVAEVDVAETAVVLELTMCPKWQFALLLLLLPVVVMMVAVSTKPLQWHF